jgi:hypothetical protein
MASHDESTGTAARRLSARARVLGEAEAVVTPALGIDAVVGRTAADHLDTGATPAARAASRRAGPLPAEFTGSRPFASQLRSKLESARVRFESEHVHLDSVETALIEYLRRNSGSGRSGS